MRNWYSMQASAAAPTTAEISIFDEIGGWGITAKEFISDLKALGDVKDINVSINSPGGSVFDGLAIYNALKASSANVTVKVMGVAASIASVIAMAGKKVVMPENSFLMVHNPWSFAMGNANDMRDMADVLDKLGESLVGTYCAKTCKPKAEIQALLDAETYLSAAEAVDMGFADEMIPNVPVKAQFDLSRLQDALRVKVELCVEEGDVLPPEDPAEPVIESTPEPAAVSPLAEQIQASAKTAGLEAYAALWALDDKIQTADDIKARIAHAKEVASFCALAGKPKMAAGFINEHLPISEVRANLRAALVAQSEENNVDTAPKTPEQPKAQKSVAQIYAERAERLAQAS